MALLGVVAPCAPATGATTAATASANTKVRIGVKFLCVGSAGTTEGQKGCFNLLRTRLPNRARVTLTVSITPCRRDPALRRPLHEPFRECAHRSRRPWQQLQSLACQSTRSFLRERAATHGGIAEAPRATS